MTLSSTFPASIDDVSSAWLADVIDAPPGLLESFTHEPIGADAGILGQLFRLHLDWRSGSTAEPQSLVLKLPTANDALRQRPLYRAIIEREVRFYRELGQSVPVRTPTAYHAEFDSENGNAVILLEDLGRGTIFPSGEAPIAEVEAIARGIAKLHAQWWNDARLTSMDWILTSEQTVHTARDLIRSNLPNVREWYGQHAPELLDLTERLPEAIEAGLFDSSPPHTLIHGDLGPKNVSFIDGEPVYFDWQLLGHGSPGGELVLLLSDASGLLSPVEIAERLLPSYHEALSAAGVTSFDYAALQEDFALWTMRGLWAPVRQLSVPGGPTPGNEAIAFRWARIAQAFMRPHQFAERIEGALARR